MKIEYLDRLNELKEKAGVLFRYGLDHFYDYYSEYDLTWLLYNAEQIELDFSKNLEVVKWHVLLNTKLKERTNLILKISEFDEWENLFQYNPHENRKKGKTITCVKLLTSLNVLN